MIEEHKFANTQINYWKILNDMIINNETHSFFGVKNVLIGLE